MTQAKIAVQKGIPLPARRSAYKAPTRSYKYPFRTMAVGDSFEVKTDKPKQFQSSIHTQTANLGRKFATRRTAENTVRVWRIL